MYLVREKAYAHSMSHVVTSGVWKSYNCINCSVSLTCYEIFEQKPGTLQIYTNEDKVEHYDGREHVTGKYFEFK